MTSSAARDRVAVTGAGVKTPAGNSVDELWKNLCAGHPTAEVFTDDRLPPGTVALVCRVSGLDPVSYLTPVEARRLDRSHALAIGAAADALGQCGELPAPARRAVVCGIGLGAASTQEEQTARLLEGGVRALSPLAVPIVMPSSVAAHLSLRFGFEGPCLTVSTACASGATAIGEGAELLRRGAADLVLAGGVDSLVGYGAMAAFLRLDVMSRNVSRPELASRPFDADRDGFVMGEGAGFVVLQRLEDVPASGARPLGFIAGHGSSADAHHLVAPSPDGAGALRCMAVALTDAGIHPHDVVHVNAHGTSTVLNDRAEAVALRALFRGACPPVTAVKGATGHMIAGSGAVEAIVSLTSLQQRLVPPVTGLRTIDPAIDLDVVQGTPRTRPPGYALSASFGFGGMNTALVLAAGE
ncbi:MAG TPA: beta-ketoacyl-[acyl-carrier-protein] synthase family protein [Streptosporangiaceae bacterium]|nr:beta-ketoacyl-[acyl-carrier-protein] synthase family protein [Streptosporangiaceae bacterium]